MNLTLQKFGYPASLIREYDHWVVMVRPKQITFGCVVIAAKSAGTSMGALTPVEAAEFPRIASDFERAMKRLAGAEKFNYVALMMVDPNPHFHAIPRYARDVSIDGITFSDGTFPKPPDLNAAHALDAKQIESIRRRLVEGW